MDNIVNNHFSVCYIAKNEEKNLAQSLQQLIRVMGKPAEKGYEILVLDTGSMDRTAEVAVSYGARVEDFEWIKDFSAARNDAMEKAKYDRILFLDADEIPEKCDLDKIIKDWNAYPGAIGRLERRNLCNSDGGGTCIFTDRVERFFDRRLYHYEGCIHEQVIKNDGGEMQGYDLALTVYHEGYYGTKEQLKVKARRNNELLFKELEKNPEDPYLYYQIGQSYSIAGEPEKELEYYEKSYSLKPDRNAEYTAMMIRSYGLLLVSRGRINDAISLIDKEFTYYSKYADFLCFAGFAYTKTGELEKAIKMYNMAFDSTMVHLEGSRDAIPEYNLGCIYEALGDELRAVEFYEKSYKKGYEKSAERLKKLRVDNYDEKSNLKKVSLIVSVDDSSKDVDDFILGISEQSVGMGHMEIVFVIATTNKTVLDILTSFEKMYEKSVCLFYPEKSDNKYSSIAKALGYTSSPCVMLLRTSDRLKWDTLRMMSLAIEKTGADVITHGVNYSDTDFMLEMADDKMRENVRRAGILSSEPYTNMYSVDFLIRSGISVEELVNGLAEIKSAKKIYCIKEKLCER